MQINIKQYISHALSSVVCTVFISSFVYKRAETILQEILHCCRAILLKEKKCQIISIADLEKRVEGWKDKKYAFVLKLKCETGILKCVY